MYVKGRKTHQLIFTAALIPLLGLAIWCEINIHRDAAKRETVKYDSSVVNSITYGLLSANAWRDDISRIITTQIDDFSLTEKQDSTLKSVVSNAMYDLIDKADSLMKKSDTTLMLKLKNLALHAFVNFDVLRKQVPEYAETIVNSLEKPKNKERLEDIAKEKLDGYAASTYDDTDSLLFENLLHKYQTENKSDFNEKTENLTEQLKKKTYRHTYILLGIMGLYLLLWVVVYKRPGLRKLLFIMSVLLALSALITGIITPMIEIDARIKNIDFVLLGQHIEFNNQMLFYQSKSIMQVVKILLKTHEADSIIVGILILAFSILLPVSKLISTEFYLMGKNKLRKNKLLSWLVLKSGKWSMADVMVVAITMTYVGLKGIVNHQMKDINMETESLTSITTNLTSLLPGFILFLGFVIFSLILSEILKRITHD